MPEPIYDPAIRELSASIGELRSVANFSVAANDLRPRLGQVLSYNGPADAVALARQFMNQKDYLLNPLFCGLFIVCCGSFERFIRRLVRDGIAELNRKTPRFSDIALQLRSQNLYRSGLALATSINPLDEFEFDYAALSKNLGTCYEGCESTTLNADAFTIHISNPTVDRIEDAAKRLGVEMDWDAIARDATVQKCFGNVGVRETTKKVKEHLKTLSKTRNKIAHTGSGPVVSAADLIFHLAYIDAVGISLAKFLENQLA